MYIYVIVTIISNEQVHDHSHAHCFMRILEGTALETRFFTIEMIYHDHDCDVSGTTGQKSQDMIHHSVRRVKLNMQRAPQRT